MIPLRIALPAIVFLSLASSSAYAETPSLATGGSELPSLDVDSSQLDGFAAPLVELPELAQYEVNGAKVTDPVGRRYLRMSRASSGVFFGGVVTSTIVGVSAFPSLGLSILVAGPPAQGLLAGGSIATMSVHRRARADLAERGVRIDDRYFGSALALTVAGMATQIGGLGVGIASDASQPGFDIERTLAIGLVTTPVGLVLSTLAIIPLAVERSMIRRGYLVVEGSETGTSGNDEAIRTRAKRSRVVVRPTVHGAGFGVVGIF